MKVTATGPIDKLRRTDVEPDQLQVLLGEALRVLDGDLQNLKYETSLVKIKAGEYVKSLNGTRGYEPIALHFETSLGVGTNVPETNLHVVSVRDNSATLAVEVNSVNAADRSCIELRRSRDWFNSRAICNPADKVADLVYSAHDGVAYQTVALQTCITPAATAATDISGELQWHTRPPGAGAAVLLRFGTDDLGNVYVGDKVNQLNAAATDGFLHVPSCAGGPTGVPTAIAGVVPVVYDDRNYVLYVYAGGAWRVH